MSILEQVEELVNRHYDSEYEKRLSLLGICFEGNIPFRTNRIFDATGKIPYGCHICGSVEKWVLEGDLRYNTIPTFVCEHDNDGLPLRIVSTITADKVSRVEVVGPLDDV